MIRQFVLINSLFLCLLSFKAFAQETASGLSKLSFNFYSSYNFKDKIDAIYNNGTSYQGHILGNYEWGTGLEYQLSNTYSTELSYYRQNASMPITYIINSQNVQTIDYNTTLNFLMVSFIRYMDVKSDRLHPYGGLMGGLAVENISATGISAAKTTKFAWGLRLGTNIDVASNWIIKVQGSIISAIGVVQPGIPEGVSGSLDYYNDYKPIMQYSLGVAVGYKF